MEILIQSEETIRVVVNSLFAKINSQLYLINSG